MGTPIFGKDHLMYLLARVHPLTQKDRAVGAIPQFFQLNVSIAKK